MVATKTSSGTQCKLLVGGEWIASTATEYQEVFNPSTGEVIAKTPMGGKADMEKSVQAAQKAFLEWKEVPVVERARGTLKLKAL